MSLVQKEKNWDLSHGIKSEGKIAPTTHETIEKTPPFSIMSIADLLELFSPKL
jgi:hypothetical protein